MNNSRNNSAVSPVIATILLVAITVVLSGVLLLMLMPFFSVPDNDVVYEPPSIIPTTSWSQPSETWIRTSNGLGDGPYITGQNIETNLTSGSISAWVKLNNPVQWGGILLKGIVNGANFDQSYGLQMAGNNLKNLFPYCHNLSHNSLDGVNQQNLLFFIAQNNSANTVNYEYFVVSNVKLIIGEWYFVVARWNATTLSMDLYDSTNHLGRNWLNVTDVLATTTNAGSSASARQALIDAGGVFIPRPSNSPLIVGGQGLNSYIFRGEIAQPSLYNTVMTPVAMNALWDYSKGSFQN